MHWSDDDIGVAGSNPDSPRQSPVERITEIMERLYLEDSRLTAELLQQLARCSTADLQRLFGCSPARMPAGAAQEAVDASYGSPGPSDGKALQELPGPSWMSRSERGQLQGLHHEPRWDENGRRLNPGKSAFPRQLRYVPGRPRGATWMSD